MKKLAVIAALLLAGCTLHFARTHTCDATCPKVLGAGARNRMPGGPVNTGACMCSRPGDNHAYIIQWRP